MLIFYQWLGHNIYLISLVVIMLGASCSYQVLAFEIASLSVPHAYSTTAVSLVQFANMAIGESIYPLMVGILMDTHANNRVGDAIAKIYNASDYQYAIMVILCGCIIAFVALMFVKEKHKTISLDL